MKTNKMKKCKEKGDIYHVYPFSYKGKTVIAIQGLSSCQLIRTYLPLWLWSLVAVYVIVRNAICDCLYLTTATIMPVIMITIGVFLWAFFSKKKAVRDNHVYDG